MCIFDILSAVLLYFFCLIVWLYGRRIDPSSSNATHSTSISGVVENKIGDTYESEEFNGRDRNCSDPCVHDVISSVPQHRRDGACHGHESMAPCSSPSVSTRSPTRRHVDHGMPVVERAIAVRQGDLPVGRQFCVEST